MLFFRKQHSKTLASWLQNSNNGFFFLTLKCWYQYIKKQWMQAMHIHIFIKYTFYNFLKVYLTNEIRHNEHKT